MNHAQVFAARFPTVSDRTGWTQANLALLIREIGQRVTPEEFDRVCQGLLRSPRREQFGVPAFGEVTGAVDRFCAARSAPRLDPTIARLRQQSESYTPPTPEERAWRRACTEGLRTGTPVPAFSEWLQQHAGGSR